MPADTPVVFPIECPACTAPEGTPFSVTAVDQRSLLIRVRCRSCAHEWTVEQDSVVEFAKKADRRQQPRMREGTTAMRDLCSCCNQPVTVTQREIWRFTPEGQRQLVVEDFRECTDASCIEMRRRQTPIPPPAMSK